MSLLVGLFLLLGSVFSLADPIHAPEFTQAQEECHTDTECELAFGFDRDGNSLE